MWTWLREKKSGGNPLNVIHMSQIYLKYSLNGNCEIHRNKQNKDLYYLIEKIRLWRYYFFFKSVVFSWVSLIMLVIFLISALQYIILTMCLK